MKKVILLATLSIALFGCVQTFVFNQPSPVKEIQSPRSDMAQVVFLRPTKGVMGAFNAIVFDVTQPTDEIIGVAPALSKFVVNLTPGKHRLFSTNGLQGHIMDVNVTAGKRYYVLVRPIYGNGFQLRPLKPLATDEFSQKNPEFASWISSTEMTIKADGVNQWYEKFKTNITKGKEDAIKVWNEKDDTQRGQLTLLPEDSEKK